MTRIVAIEEFPALDSETARVSRVAGAIVGNRVTSRKDEFETASEILTSDDVLSFWTTEPRSGRRERHSLQHISSD